METIIGAVGAAFVVLLTLVELFLPAERQTVMDQRVSPSRPPR